MAGAVAPPSGVSERADEMVRMAHSGHLPPSLAAFKQQLLHECERVAARGDDHELRMVVLSDFYRSCCGTWGWLALYECSVPTSAGSKESYQQNPWDRAWHLVRPWLVGGAERVTSVCLLLALLPSLHPRLTYLEIQGLSKLKVMGGAGEWVAQAVEALCAAMISLCRQSANTITHLHLNYAHDDDMMVRGSVHLSHLLRSTHCNLLSLRLDYDKLKDDVSIAAIEGGDRELTTLGHIAQALQVNTTVTVCALCIRQCKLCTSTAHEIAALLSVKTILQRLRFDDVHFTQEGAARVRRALCGAQSGSTSKAPTIPFGSGALTTLDLESTNLSEMGTSWGVPWLGDMLAHNVSLQTLTLQQCGLRYGAGRDLAQGLRQSSSSLRMLDISYNVGLTAQDMQHIFSALENHATLQILKCGSTSDGEVWEKGKMELEDMVCALARMISRNQSLHTLEFPGAPFSATQWSEHIVPALLANGTLQSVDFRGSKGFSETQVVESLLHFIRTNASFGLPPSVAAFKQQLLHECERVAASADDRELMMKLDGSPSGCLSLRKCSVPSVGSKKYYKHNMFYLCGHRRHVQWEKSIVRQWTWHHVLGYGVCKWKKENFPLALKSVCLLLALLPSLHPRLTHLSIDKCALSFPRTPTGHQA